MTWDSRCLTWTLAERKHQDDASKSNPPSSNRPPVQIAKSEHHGSWIVWILKRILLLVTMFANSVIRRAPSPKRSFFRRVEHNLYFSTAPPTDRLNDARSNKEDLEYCINLVRDRDREGFYCGMLMPKESQRAYFVIRALNVELASVKEIHHARPGTETGSTSKSVALQLRLQWWNDAIKQVYGEDAKRSRDPALANFSISCWESPIVRALYNVNQEKQFTRRFLERLVEAREIDLDLDQFATIDEAKNYAEQSVSSLLYLTLESLGVREDAADEVASYAGTGIGLTTALRGTPVRLSNGECPIPKDLLGPNFPRYDLVDKVYGENKLSEENAEIFREACQTLALTATSYLMEARERQNHVPKNARTALLPVIPSLQYLSRLEKAKFDALDASLFEPNRFQLLFGLGRTWLTGIF